MKTLAIDPGSRLLGWCIFQDDAIWAYGEMNMLKVPYAERTAHIVRGLDSLSRVVDAVAVEEAVRFKGMKIPELEVVCRAIRKWAKGHGLSYASYNPATWKKGFAGSPRATKEQVARYLYLQYPGLPADLSDHITDAMAIGVYHMQLQRFERMVACHFDIPQQAVLPLEGG